MSAANITNALESAQRELRNAKKAQSSPRVRAALEKIAELEDKLNNINNNNNNNNAAGNVNRSIAQQPNQMPINSSSLEHKNTKLTLNQKMNKAMSILAEKGLQTGFKNAIQYIINTKVPEEYGSQAKYTPEWILAKEWSKRLRGGRTHRKRKTLRKTRRNHKQRQ